MKELIIIFCKNNNIPYKFIPKGKNAEDILELTELVFVCLEDDGLNGTVVKYQDGETISYNETSNIITMGKYICDALNKEYPGRPVLFTK